MSSSKHEFKGAIFDVDGVIVDTAHIHHKSWEIVFKKYGKTFTFKDFKSKIDGKPRAFGAKTILPEATEKQIKEVCEEKQKHFERILNTGNIKIFKTTVAFIKLLKKKGIKLAMASSSKNAGPILKKVKIYPHFDAEVEGGLLKKGKPHPDIFLIAAKKLKLKPSECIVFEDAQIGIDAGKGSAGNIDDAERETLFGSAFAQLDWRRSLGADEDLAFSLSHSQESYRDNYPYSLIPLGINDSIDISADGRASNDTVSLQHTFSRGPALRVVWGGELRREQVTSKPIYNTDAALLTGFTRLFANAEWGLASELVFNAAVMAEHSSVSGDSFAPRLMLNWHFAEGQTLRGGLSRAFRPPSSFEQFGDVRYSYKDVPLLATTLARGNIQAESILVQEFGYLGDFPKHGVNLDVRVFNEQISGFIVHQRYALPAGATLLLSTPWDYFNGQNFSIRGLEYQTKWRPWSGAQLTFNQAYARISSADPGDALAAPRLASSITYFQKLTGGLDLSLMYQGNGTATLQGAGGASGGQVAMTRADLRLAWPLRIGANRGEVALVVQNLGSPYADFAPAFQFRRRAFVTLRLEN